MIRMYNKNLIPKAQYLRKNMTPQESKLWYNFLRNYPIRFRRQKPITMYIVDFYCFKAKLVIEVDGNQHYTKEGLIYDKKRTEFLNSFNLKVIRFRNEEIDNNFEEVCNIINCVIEERIKT